MLFCNLSYGDSSEKILAMIQHILQLLEDAKIKKDLADMGRYITTAQSGNDPIDSIITWCVDDYYEAFYLEGVLFIANLEHIESCPPKTPGDTQANTPIGDLARGGQTIFPEDEDSNQAFPDRDGSDEGDSQEPPASADHELHTRDMTGWYFFPQGDTQISRAGTLRGALIERYNREEPQVLFRFRLTPPGVEKVDEHVHFKTGRLDDQIYMVITCQLVPGIYIEFDISLGKAAFNHPQDLIDDGSEFQGVQWTMLDTGAIFDFIREYERNYNPDFPEINIYLQEYLGTGVSSQVANPLYFLRSMVLKRLHKPCRTEAEAKEVIASARANIMLMRLAGVPWAPVAYLYVHNEKRNDYVIYSMQPRYAKGSFADHVLGDSSASWDEKKTIIDTIISYLKKCEGRNPLNPTGDPRQGFVFAVDPNFPNYCQLNDQWVLADMSPFFFAVNDDFAIGNQYILNLENSFYEHAKTLCTNPVRRYIFFLGMIYREYLRHEQVNQQYVMAGALHTHAAEQALIWRKIYKYAVDEVYSLPQMQHELSTVNHLSQLLNTDVEPSREERQKMIEYWLDQLANPEYKVSERYYQLINQADESDGDGLTSAVFEANRQYLWDLSARFGMRINERVQTRIAANKYKVKDDTSGGFIKSKRLRQHGPLNDQEFKLFIGNTLGMEYHPIPRDNYCFWHSILAGVQQFMPIGMSHSEGILWLEQAVHALQPPIQQGILQSLGTLFDPPHWGATDNIPVVLQVLNEYLGKAFRILVIHPNEHMQPVGIIYHCNPEFPLVEIHVLHSIEEIQAEAKVWGTIILANHQTGSAGPFQDQHWGLVTLPPIPPESQMDMLNPVVAPGVKINPFNLPVSGWLSIPDRFEQEFQVQLVDHMRRENNVSGTVTEAYQNDLLLAIEDFLANIGLQDNSIKSKLPERMKVEGYIAEEGSQAYLHALIMALLDVLDDYDLVPGVVGSVALIQPNLSYQASQPSYAVWVIYRFEGQILTGRYFQYVVDQRALRYILEHPGTVSFFSNGFVSRAGDYLLPNAFHETGGWWWISSKANYFQTKLHGSGKGRWDQRRVQDETVRAGLPRRHRPNMLPGVTAGNNHPGSMLAVQQNQNPQPDVGGSLDEPNHPGDPDSMETEDVAAPVPGSHREAWQKRLDNSRITEVEVNIPDFVLSKYSALESVGTEVAVPLLMPLLSQPVKVLHSR